MYRIRPTAPLHEVSDCCIFQCLKSYANVFIVVPLSYYRCTLHPAPCIYSTTLQLLLYPVRVRVRVCTSTSTSAAVSCNRYVAYNSNQIPYVLTDSNLAAGTILHSLLSGPREEPEPTPSPLQSPPQRLKRPSTACAAQVVDRCRVLLVVA